MDPSEMPDDNVPPSDDKVPYWRTPEVRAKLTAYQREYRKRPYVKAKELEYRERPEVRQRTKEYHHQYHIGHKEKIHQYKKQYQLRPDVAAKRKAYNSTPKARARRDECTRRYYSINKHKRQEQQLRRKLKEQNNYAIMAGRPKPDLCDICGKIVGGKICYDHCHTYGHFRGFICTRCNVVLGLVYDDPTLLHLMADYLDNNIPKADEAINHPSWYKETLE